MKREYVELESAEPRDRIILGEPVRPMPIEGFPDFGHIAFKGLANARDLGGMPAADGRRIAPRRLIRSDALQHLHREDADELLDGYGLRQVVDFRTDMEREGQRDRLELLSGVTVHHLPVFKEEAVGITRGNGPADEIEAARAMLGNPFEKVRELYPVALIGDAGIAAYRQFLAELLDQTEGAILWHCTEGKDRAGLASYIVEAALGVPDEDRRADYLATNLFVRSGVDRFFDNLARVGIAQTFAKEIDAFFYAFEAYLDAGLDAVRERFGSFDGYLAEALDFGPEKQQQLRANYLL